MKKTFLITLSVMLVISGLIVSNFAWAADPVLSLQPSKSTVAINETFTVNVNIDAKDKSVAAVELHINFPTQLQGVSIVTGQYFPVVLTGGAISGNSASLVLGASPTAPKTGTGTMAVLTLKALANPGVPLQISFATTTQVGVIGVSTSAIGAVNPTSVTVSGTITSPTPTPLATPWPTATPSITPTATPSPTSSIGLVRFGNNPKVYQILPGMRIKWVPTVNVFNLLSLNWKNLSVKSASLFKNYKRVKLVRANGSDSVYYITEGGLKRLMPTADVFLSYGNKWEDIVIVEQFELNAIPDNIVVRVAGDERVYKIEGNTKKWIPTADVFNRNNFKWNEVASINQTELDYYLIAVNVE